MAKQTARLLSRRPEAQKPNSDGYRDGWDAIWGKAHEGNGPAMQELKDTCMCGESMGNHDDMWRGHLPVSMYDYYVKGDW